MHDNAFFRSVEAMRVAGAIAIGALWAPTAFATPLSERASTLAAGDAVLLGTYEDLVSASTDDSGWHTFEYSFRMTWVRRGALGTGRLVHLGSGHGSGRWQLTVYDEATDSWSHEEAADLDCHVHSYDQFAVDAASGELYSLCLDGELRRWDGESWTALARWPGGYPTLMASEYSAETRSLWVANGFGDNDEVYSFDLETREWIDRGSVAIGENLDILYSPIHRRTVMSGGDDNRNVYLLGSDGSITRTGTTTPHAWRVKRALADYDPVNGDILLFFADDDSIHRYDPVADRLTSLGTFAGQPPFTMESSPEEAWGHGVVIATIPDYAVIMFADDISGEVWLYRPSEGAPGLDGGTTPDAGSSPGADSGAMRADAGRHARDAASRADSSAEAGDPDAADGGCSCAAAPSIDLSWWLAGALLLLRRRSERGGNRIDRRRFLEGTACGLVALAGGCGTSAPSTDAGSTDGARPRGDAADNRAPEWRTIPSIAFVEGVAASVSVADYVSDPDGDSLRVVRNEIELPPGVTFDAANLRFVYDGTGAAAETEGHVLTADDGR